MYRRGRRDGSRKVEATAEEALVWWWGLDGDESFVFPQVSRMSQGLKPDWFCIFSARVVPWYKNFARSEFAHVVASFAVRNDRFAMTDAAMNLLRRQRDDVSTGWSFFACAALGAGRTECAGAHECG
jgi:hypothetical protein